MRINAAIAFRGDGNGKGDEFARLGIQVLGLRRTI